MASAADSGCEDEHHAVEEAAGEQQGSLKRCIPGPGIYSIADDNSNVYTASMAAGCKTEKVSEFASNHGWACPSRPSYGAPPSPPPLLRLRGGAADAKRRELRKRRFGHLQHLGIQDGQEIYKSRREAEEGEVEIAVLSESPEGAARAETRVDTCVEGSSTEESGVKAGNDSKAPRFIVFVGNLPFTTTTESLTQHFTKVKPTSIRHRTEKGTSKSRGFAFLEFDAYDRMKTCLKLYHHSELDDGQSPTRKINVELTSGGGGAKSKERRSKLQAKNAKLNEERRRRALEEQQQQQLRSKNAKVEEAKGEITVAQPDETDIHPSRRGIVPIT